MGGLALATVGDLALATVGLFLLFFGVLGGDTVVAVAAVMAWV